MSHEPQDLPDAYNTDRIVLMPRDPEWLYAYWELSRERRMRALAELGTQEEAARTALRVTDVTDVVDRATGRPRLDDAAEHELVEVAPSADHWHFRVNDVDRLYCVEYVVIGPEGRTLSLAVSNMAATPSNAPSNITEEKWVSPVSTEAPAERPADSGERKWQTGHEHLHEALSSSASAPNSHS